MRILNVHHKALNKLLRVQIPEPGQIIRPFTYLITAKVPEGLLVYQESLCDLVLLEGDECSLLKQDMLSGELSETQKYLLEHGFLVQDDQDDGDFCQNVREAARLVRFLTNKKGYPGFTILTTTSCNARCFYCFEKGLKNESMTEETADTVAKFILDEGNPDKVRLGWFGGEPTVNSKVIDRITKTLSDAGRKYTSSMISNGFLFDEELVKKASELWKLESIQITLDGTEETYNTRKAYVGVTESAFQRVIKNIGLLLDAGIRVSIRLNVDTENADDLCELSKQLERRFRGKENLNIYARSLFENDCMTSTLEERMKEDQRVEKHLEELGYQIRQALDIFPQTAHCMADSGSAPVIMPDGSLKSCEHINSSSDWGSVFDPKPRPEKETAFWNEKLPELEECKDCLAYPSCIRLKHCETETEVCSESVKQGKIKVLQQRLLYTWDVIKERKKQEESK